MAISTRAETDPSFQLAPCNDDLFEHARAQVALHETRIIELEAEIDRHITAVRRLQALKQKELTAQRKSLSYLSLARRLPQVIA